MGQVAGSASPASRLPQVMGAVQALWELACQGWGGLQGQHRRQAGSHRYWVQCRPDGRLLARDGAGAESASPVSRLPQVLGAVHALWELACQRWGRCRVSIAGKPAPTGIGCSAGLVGDGLPGMGRVAESASPASRLPQVMGAVQALWELACQRWAGLQDYHRRKPPLRVKTPSASRCCFCVQPLWAHRRNNPGAGLSAGDCGKCPGAFRKWCTCATCDPGTGSRYCSCAAG